MKDNLHFYKNPPARFRGAPFWSWNGKLDREQLLRQIGYFREMGMGGYTVHVRTGLDTPYLGEEFLARVRDSVEEGKRFGMETHLYDDDRWPSGYGGGFVTKDEAYRYRILVMTTDAPDGEHREPYAALFAHNAPDDGKRELLAKYEITLKDGFLTSYRLLSEDETGENVWYAYKEIGGSTPWFANQSYVDTLNPDATKRFLETSHEVYKKEFSADFGEAVPTIFTDEPEHVLFGHLSTPADRGPVSVPYTDTFDEQYAARYGESVFAHLPEVFWELPDGRLSVHRYRYHDFVSELFAQNYAGVLGRWCEENGIRLTGHMMDEDSLQNQTRSVGEAMRSYPHFQLPGIDILCNSREYTTAKQAQSVARQTGREGLTSELYGVTNWDFDFRGHKLQGDWQAALGVIHRVPHLSYMTMAGEAKRDYPASIFYQSPWYKQYPLIEDYFARVNTALTTGDPQVRVGVIHPIESFWLLYGISSQTERAKERAERDFHSIVEWLLADQIDFDFLAESLLPTLPHKDARSVGEMTYDVLLVPPLITIRATTLAFLAAFEKAGGRVIFLGDAPTLVDAEENGDAAAFADSRLLPFERDGLINTLKDYRDIEVVNPNGTRCRDYLYQLRRRGDDRILFLARMNDWFNRDIPRGRDVKVRVRGTFAATELAALKGDEQKLSCTCRDGWTEIPVSLFDQDSLLLLLTAAPADFAGQQGEARRPNLRTVMPLSATRYETEEPNALLLDRASYSLDGGAWEPEEEVLRVDNILRRRVGFPTKPSSLPQPWLIKEEPSSHTVKLRFTFSSDLATDALFAVEPQQDMTITCNGTPVDLTPAGYFTDESIVTYRLPKLKAGQNELLLSMAFTPRTNLEWCYLLGDFGVRLTGCEASVTEKPALVGFCDLTRQQMPFYAANVKIYSTFTVEEGDYAVKVPKFRAPLVTVSVDGKAETPVAFAPYTASLGHLSAGEHTVCFRVFGNRYNCFGPLHLADEGRGWIDPNAWRSHGDEYCREYLVRPFGILTSPTLMREE